MRVRAVVRQTVADDAEAVAAVRRVVAPYKVMSPAATRHMITVQSPGERFLPLLAERDGEVVGVGRPERVDERAGPGPPQHLRAS